MTKADTFLYAAIMLFCVVAVTIFLDFLSLAITAQH